MWLLIFWKFFYNYFFKLHFNNYSTFPHSRKLGAGPFSQLDILSKRQGKEGEQAGMNLVEHIRGRLGDSFIIKDLLAQIKQV